MSSIKVWTSDGDWSTPINGCDKVHLMKEAITYEFLRIVGDKKGLGLDCYKASVTNLDLGTKTEELCHESKLQIDNKLIDVVEFKEYDKKSINQDRLNERKDIPQATFFKMKLSTLNGMAEKDAVMADLYKKIEKCAKVSSTAKKDYCLLMMFEDE